MVKRFMDFINENVSKFESDVLFREINVGDIFLLGNDIFIKEDDNSAILIKKIKSLRSIKENRKFEGTDKVLIPIYGTYEEIISMGIEVGKIKDDVLRLNHLNKGFRNVLLKSDSFEDYKEGMGGSYSDIDLKRIWNNNLMDRVSFGGIKYYIVTPNSNIVVN